MDNEAIVESDYILSRAIIGPKNNSSRYRIEILLASLRKLNEVFDSGTAETVKRLVIITDNTNVLVSRRKLEEYALLDRVCILILVYNNMAKYLT